MSDDAKKPLYEPSFGVRLVLWLAVYSSVQIAFYIYAVVKGFKEQPSTHGPDPSGLLLLFLFFPCGLAPGVPFFGYIFYLIHLIATFCVRNKKGFKIALFLLFVAVVMNLVGCMEMNKSLSHVTP